MYFSSLVHNLFIFFLISMSDYSTLVIALKGCDNIETDGCIIRLKNDADIHTIRTLGSKKLGLAIPLDDIILETSGGETLNDIDRIKLEQVIYINTKDQIKEVPVPHGLLPYVGDLYSMIPDL